METRTRHEGRTTSWKHWIGIGIVLVVVLVVGFVTSWFGLATARFEPGVQYEFSYTMKSTVPGEDADGNKIAIPTRQFVVDQTTMFPAAESGLVEDLSLPPNTFVFYAKTQPAIAVGGNIVRGAYMFVEVRYNSASKEPQSVIPHLVPNGSRSPTQKSRKSPVG